jgi:hypothetical protein
MTIKMVSIKNDPGNGLKTVAYFFGGRGSFRSRLAD